MKSEFSDESKGKLETIIAGTMESVHAPGLSIALVRDGEVVYAGGFGARNVEHNLPATPRAPSSSPRAKACDPSRACR